MDKNKQQKSLLKVLRVARQLEAFALAACSLWSYKSCEFGLHIWANIRPVLK